MTPETPAGAAPVAMIRPKYIAVASGFRHYLRTRLSFYDVSYQV